MAVVVQTRSCRPRKRLRSIYSVSDGFLTPSSISESQRCSDREPVAMVDSGSPAERSDSERRGGRSLSSGRQGGCCRRTRLREFEAGSEEKHLVFSSERLHLAPGRCLKILSQSGAAALSSGQTLLQFGGFFSHSALCGGVKITYYISAECGKRSGREEQPEALRDAASVELHLSQPQRARSVRYQQRNVDGGASRALWLLRARVSSERSS